jgi:hypothetical protein
VVIQTSASGPGLAICRQPEGTQGGTLNPIQG